MTRLTNQQRQQRDLDIANGKDPREVADMYGLSLSHVYRIRRDILRPESFQGQSADPSALSIMSELAQPGLKQYGGVIDEDYDRVFKPLDRKVKLFQQMADDPTAAAVINASKMTLRRIGWSVQPAGSTRQDGEADQFLDSCMNDMSLSWVDVIDQALDMLQDGFVPAEIVYKRRLGKNLYRPGMIPGALGDSQEHEAPESKYSDGRIGWRKWVFVSPDTLAPGASWIFDPHGGLRGFNQQPVTGSGKSIPVPIAKAVLFRTAAKKNNPEGRSLLRPMYQPWYYKHNLEEIEAISGERMGAGYPVIYLGSDVNKDPNNPAADIAYFRSMGRNIRVDEQMAAVIPFKKMGTGASDNSGVLLEFLSPPGQGNVDFDRVIQRYDKRMAMVGLAQFIHLGMDRVGTQALAKTTTDFFELAISSWADLIEETIHRYATERLFGLNYFPGLTDYPRIVHDPVGKVSLGEMADYINKLASSGVITASPELEDFLRAAADLPERTPDSIEVSQNAKPDTGEGEGDAGLDSALNDNQPLPDLAHEKFTAGSNGVMIAFYLDPETARKIAVEGGEPPDDLHVTLAMLGDARMMSPKRQDRLSEVVRSFAVLAAPLSGEMTGPAEFKASGEQKPIVILFDSPALPKWRQTLVDVLGMAGFPIAAEHGYIPYITIKYGKPDEKPKIKPLPKKLVFDAVSLVIGGHRTDFGLGNVDQAEPFAVDRRGGRGRPSEQLRAVNQYQGNLESAYNTWADGFARDLSVSDDDEWDTAIGAALLALLVALRDLGRRELTDAMLLALGGEPPSPDMLQELAEAIAENDRYLADSLIPSLEDKIRRSLLDPDILAARALGVIAFRAALRGILSTVTARVASYAGAWWQIYNRILGRVAQQRGERIVAYLDPTAKHCDDCPQFHAAEGRVYTSFQQYLDATSGRVPGEFECAGNCRCELRRGGGLSGT